jgi:acetoacetate decarboxylase
MPWRPWPNCRFLEVVSTVHILSDLTLGLGKVVHDYLAPSDQRQIRSKEKVDAS